MDVKVSPVKAMYSKRYILPAVTLVFSVFSVWLYSQPSASSQVEVGQLWLGQVNQGALALEVTGFGVLESKVQRFLTAANEAVIEEILLKPGAVVTPDSVILTMSNPGIGQALVQAELALKAEKGKLKQLVLTQEREMLDANNQQAELRLDLDVVKARFEAETKLANSGIVTQLTLLETQAQVNKLSGRLANSQQRLAQLTRLHQQSLQIQKEQIDEKQSLLALAKDRMARLQVKAGIDGVLQALPVELGQSVSVGSQLALVGGTDELIAVVQVPQRDVQGMMPGMQASIDTRGGVAEGEVRLIDPVVKEGNVEVEIALTGTLPDNARPSLNVEARIRLGTLPDALYIKAPVNVAQHSRHQVFKVDDERHTAELTWLEFGAKSGQFIEIKAGAARDQRFILSDMRQYAEQSHISLN
ncbi:efflux RND transporter periplasmic adaptor subunit [Bowmanella denitrificans]|uniref:Efflux RND transporter periplasmic adaptor subunit n=1 Tax=Bowmanella denitrificans TaxID=366582 RepID=A0ABP3GN89_9ALTE